MTIRYSWIKTHERDTPYAIQQHLDMEFRDTPFTNHVYYTSSAVFADNMVKLLNAAVEITTAKLTPQIQALQAENTALREQIARTTE